MRPHISNRRNPNALKMKIDKHATNIRTSFLVLVVAFGECICLGQKANNTAIMPVRITGSKNSIYKQNQLLLLILSTISIIIIIIIIISAITISIITITVLINYK